MQERRKVESRKIFTREEKREILSKSDGKCCRCGKSISIGDDFTVEHVIPISKGGSNDISNLIALCKTCNVRKDNYVIHPNSCYTRYLKDEYFKELCDIFDKYTTDFDWFDISNYIKIDKMNIPFELITGSAAKCMKSKHKQYAGVKTTGYLTLSKAVYSDLDSIYDYMLKYYKKYSISTNNVKQKIDYIFSVGAIYTLRNKGGEIIAVIPVSIQPVEVYGASYICLSLEGILILYQREAYLKPVSNVLSCIIGGICHLYPDGYKDLAVSVNFFRKDSFSSNAFVLLYGAGKEVSIYNSIHVYEDDDICKLLVVSSDSIMASNKEDCKNLMEITTESLLNGLGMSIEEYNSVIDYNTFCGSRWYIGQERFM